MVVAETAAAAFTVDISIDVLAQFSHFHNRSIAALSRKFYLTPTMNVPPIQHRVLNLHRNICTCCSQWPHYKKLKEPAEREIIHYSEDFKI